MYDHSLCTVTSPYPKNSEQEKSLFVVMPKFGNHQLSYSIQTPLTSLAQGVNTYLEHNSSSKEKFFVLIQDMIQPEMARGMYRPYSDGVSDYMLNLVISTLITKMALLASPP